MITWSNVEALDASLSAVPVEAQAVILEIASARVDTTTWGDRADLAMTLVAAHHGVQERRGRRSGQVVSESIGGVTRAYAAGGVDAWDATTWGRLFQQMLRTLPAARLPVVI